MPSIQELLRGYGTGSIMRLNNQQAQITLPPLMKVAYAQSVNDPADIELLPADSGLCYVIHAFQLYGDNDAGSTATGFSVRYKDFWTGLSRNLETCYLTPAQVNNVNARMSGLNILTQPGQSLDIHASSGLVARSKSATLYYSELRL